MPPLLQVSLSCPYHLYTMQWHINDLFIDTFWSCKQHTNKNWFNKNPSIVKLTCLTESIRHPLSWLTGEYLYNMLFKQASQNMYMPLSKIMMHSICSRVILHVNGHGCSINHLHDFADFKNLTLFWSRLVSS